MTQSGGTTTTTASYGSLAESVNGTLSYLLSDGLGSISEAVSTAGQVTATQLYAPYGGVRYQSGTLPTDKGYTGQRSDAATSGLDYYGARYYDPVAGQFTSADTTLAGGLNRYAYVAGNPETKADPTGHAYTCPTGACGPSAGGDPTAPANPTNPTPTLPTSKESGGAAAGSGTGANGSGSAESRTNNLTTKGACDPQCQRDTQLILNYLELKRNQNHLGADILALLADTAIAIVDYATQSWVSFVTDVVTFIVQAGQVGKDIAILHGASAQSLVGLNQVLSVMQGIVVAMNAALAVGWLAMLANGPGGLVSGGFKEGVKFILGTFGSMTQVAGAWSGMTDDAIDAQEAQLESASPQQRHQVCLSMKISGC